jgi:quinol monooxygenase YgiN
MPDVDLRDDMLKLVRYKILFVKRDLEYTFPEREELVSENIDSTGYTAWKIAQFIQDLGSIEIPTKWRSKKYPRDPGSDTAPKINSLDEEDKKYLRVYYEVLDRYPRERFKHEERQIEVLEQIRDKLRSESQTQDPTPELPPDLKPLIDQLRAQVSHMLSAAPQASPIAAIVIFQVDQAKEAQFRRMADALTEATRQLPGCNVFAFHRAPQSKVANAVEYLIYEDWETTAFFRTQWDSRHLKDFQYNLGGLMVALPDLRFYEGWREYRKDGVGTVARVAQTGQKRCWNTGGTPIDCQGTGQDGEIQAGMAWPTPRFTDHNDGTVTDHLTGLVWLKDADRFGEVPWEEALRHARTLAGGGRGLTDGSTAGDWRLPTIRELFSLIDYGTADPIIPAGHPFTNVRSSIYWTSTTLAAAPTLAWMMTLGIGPTVFDLKINANRMWPVRGQSTCVAQTGQKMCWDSMGKEIPCRGTGQDGEIQAGVAWPTPRFTDNGDGTVTDQLTGLVWLKNANPFGWRTWEQALRDCHELASGSHGLTDGSVARDWRLPNIREIESLVDYNNAGPCLPTGHPFTNVRPSSYWTSTSVAAAPTEAMFIILGVGPAIFESKEHPFFVWPVRDRRAVRGPHNGTPRKCARRRSVWLKHLPHHSHRRRVS